MENKKEYIKGIALVVGINEYENIDKLDNAVFDAESFADALEKLKFKTLKYSDITVHKFVKVIEEFVGQLNDYNVAVFYFAGHGMEIKGQNYLLSKDDAKEESYITHFSVKLQEIIDKINETKCDTKILIIDACRNNPFANGRGFGTINLAPIFAPQGTIIAYSTSPGQTAMDGGIGNNSIYTGALIKHISELGLPIESFFKKVRTTVYNLSGGKQISWEHTSLIGNFSFNSGQMIHYLDVPYSLDVVVDRDYDYNNDPKLAKIMEGFKSNNYYFQNDSLNSFESIKPSCLNENQLFIIGRNILQSACGGAFSCLDFIKDSNRIAKYTLKGSNHLLNGMLFEMYFDKNSDLRKKVKSFDLLSILLKYHTIPSLQPSFEFINKVLLPLSDKLLFIPSAQMNSVTFEVLLNKEKGKVSPFDNESDFYVIKSIKCDVKELLSAKENNDNCFNKLDDLDELNDIISTVFEIPIEYVKIIPNIPNLDLPILLKSSIGLYNN